MQIKVLSQQRTHLQNSTGSSDTYMVESACPSSNLFFEKLFAAVTNSNNIALFENLKLCKYAA